jgi:hypothetical protein
MAEFITARRVISALSSKVLIMGFLRFIRGMFRLNLGVSTIVIRVAYSKLCKNGKGGILLKRGLTKTSKGGIPHEKEIRTKHGRNQFL